MSNNIAIVCDSVADMPKDMLEEYGIDVVSLTTKINNVEYRDVDIDCEDFYALMKSSKELPKTSQATYVDFIDVFKKHVDNGKKVIYISVSSKASGTYQSAMLAKSDIDGEIHIFDSLSLSFGIGILVLQAARMAKKNYSVEEILSKLEEMRDSSAIALAPNSLEYLHKGGRLSTSKAMVGSILNIKPILTMSEGVIVPAHQVRGGKKVFPTIIKMLRDNWNEDFSDKIIGIAYGDSYDDYIKLESLIKDELNPQELIAVRMNSSVCSHTGPDVLGVICIKNNI